MKQLQARNFLIVLALLALTFGALGITPAQAAGTEIIYYKFDNAGGTSVANEAATPLGNNPAPLMGALSMGGVGQSGSALIGTGGLSSTDFVDTGWPLNFGTGSWEVSFWINNLPTGGGSATYLLGEVSTSFRVFAGGVAGTDGIIMRGAGMTDVLVSGVVPAQPAVVRFVYDASVPEIKAYLNGTLANTVSQPALNIVGANPLKVGGYSGSTGLPSGALLDDVRIVTNNVAPLPSYYPLGPQANVDESQLTGWEMCWSSLYNSSADTLAAIQSQCSGNYLLLAGGPVSSTVFDVVAAGPRADVLFDTGTGNTPHNANGVGWYYNSNWSWGYALEGDPIDRYSCDVLTTPNSNLRLCWHTNGGNINGGYRSGANLGLNSSTTYRRAIFQPVPGAFGKTSPADTTIDVANSPTLQWGSSSGQTDYEYCYDSNLNGACDGTWTSTSNATSVGLSGLNSKTQYEWQVRAVDGVGYTEADSGTWWTFTTNVFPPGVDCATQLLGSSQSGNLFTVDLATGTATQIALMPTGFATEIEFDRTAGDLWAKATDGNSLLARIDPGTGASLFSVGVSPFGAVNGLEYVGTTLYGTYMPGASMPSSLVTVDTATGVLTVIGATGFNQVTGLAYDASTGIMYGVTAGAAPSDLITINLATGAGTVVGSTGFSKVGSLEFGVNGVLYGGTSTATGAGPGSLISIDTVTGAGTLIGATTYSVTGLTSCAPALIEVLIAGTSRGTYNIPSGGSTRESYAGVNDGPVKVISTGGAPILAAQRILYTGLGTDPTSFVEMMGLPVGQVDTTYWFPWYKNDGIVDTQLRIGNVSGSTATVHIYIAGVEVTGSPFTLTTSGAGQSQRLSFALNDGPVKVVSDQNIVATERLIYFTNGDPTSFSEMMGLPNSQLSTTYWFPWYKNVGEVDTQLRIGNVSSSTATVYIYIAGVEVTGSPFTLTTSGAGQSQRLSFPINDGPVKIVSDQNIVAAQRLIYYVGGLPISFVETMGIPNGQLSTTHWFPWYKNDGIVDTQIRIGNVSGTAASVHVYIGTTEMAGSPFALTATGAGQSLRLSFAENNGPVKLVSDQNIVSSERLIYFLSGVPVSFSEMMGLPDGLLGPTYLLPWYKNVGEIDTQLRFGVP